MHFMCNDIVFSVIIIMYLIEHFYSRGLHCHRCNLHMKTLILLLCHFVFYISCTNVKSAIISGDLLLVKELLNSGAEIDTSAFRLALARGHDRIAKLLQAKCDCKSAFCCLITGDIGKNVISSYLDDESIYQLC